jgi:site-specific DNA-methyltransferase (adenine-specific)
VNYRERGGRRIINDDNAAWIYPAFSQVHRLLKDNSFCISFYGWNQVDKFLVAWRECGFKPLGHFVWVKTYSSSVGYSKMWHECAYLLVKGRPARPVNPPPDVLTWGKYSGNKLHQTQKPVSALVPILQAYSKQGDVVLDPFGGSATCWPTSCTGATGTHRILGMNCNAPSNTMRPKRRLERHKLVGTVGNEFHRRFQWKRQFHEYHPVEHLGDRRILSA